MTIFISLIEGLIHFTLSMCVVYTGEPSQSVFKGIMLVGRQSNKYNYESGVMFHFFDDE